MDRLVLEGSSDTAQRFRYIGEAFESYIEDAQKQIDPAEMQLKWVEEQLSAIHTECTDSTTPMSTPGHSQDQPRFPRKASRLDQGINNHKNKKRRPSANSALGPIHSSKVSKASEKKTHRPQRSLRIPAERDDSQDQGLEIAISSSPPTNATPRRSRRLSANQNKSSELEADVATNVERNALPQPTETLLRRSDRISNQKETTSSSTSSSPALSSTKSLHTASLPRSRPKGQTTGMKSNSNQKKLRSVSKRRGTRLSQKRSKIHT